MRSQYEERTGPVQRPRLSDWLLLSMMLLLYRSCTEARLHDCPMRAEAQHISPGRPSLPSPLPEAPRVLLGECRWTRWFAG